MKGKRYSLSQRKQFLENLLAGQTLRDSAIDAFKTKASTAGSIANRVLKQIQKEISENPDTPLKEPYLNYVAVCQKVGIDDRFLAEKQKELLTKADYPTQARALEMIYKIKRFFPLYNTQSQSKETINFFQNFFIKYIKSVDQNPEIEDKEKSNE